MAWGKPQALLTPLLFQKALSSFLFSLLFAPSFSLTHFLAIDKEQAPMILIMICFGLEVQRSSLFLGPFDQAAFGIRFGSLQAFDIERAYEGTKDPLPCPFESFIQVISADHGFQSISSDPGILEFFRSDLLVQEAKEVQPFSQLVEPLPAYEFGAHLGQEAFIGIGIMLKEVFGNDRIEDGISQELEPFIAKAGIAGYKGGAMPKCLSVKLRTPCPDPQVPLQFLSKALRRRGSSQGQASGSLNMTEELCPPNPKVLLTAALTSRSLASLKV